MKFIFITVSVILQIGSVIPYVRDIVRGKTKPNIVSWLTWTLLTLIATIAEVAAHEYRTAIITGAAVVETAIIVILGLKYGYAKWSKFDTVCQIAALSGFFFWWLFNSPVYAIISVVTIDLFGAMPTIRHSWKNPEEETTVTYAMASIGGLAGIFALTSINWTSLTYPAYIVTINAVLVFILFKRSKVVKSVTK